MGLYKTGLDAAFRQNARDCWDAIPAAFLRVRSGAPIRRQGLPPLNDLSDLAFSHSATLLFFLNCRTVMPMVRSSGPANSGLPEPVQVRTGREGVEVFWVLLVMCAVRSALPHRDRDESPPLSLAINRISAFSMRSRLALLWQSTCEADFYGTDEITALQVTEQKCRPRRHICFSNKRFLEITHHHQSGLLEFAVDLPRLFFKSIFSRLKVCFTPFRYMIRYVCCTQYPRR